MKKICNSMAKQQELNTTNENAMQNLLLQFRSSLLQRPCSSILCRWLGHIPPCPSHRRPSATILHEIPFHHRMWIWQQRTITLLATILDAIITVINHLIWTIVDIDLSDVAIATAPAITRSNFIHSCRPRNGRIIFQINCWMIWTKC